MVGGKEMLVPTNIASLFTLGIKNKAIRQKVHEHFSRADADDSSAIDRFGYPLFPVSQLRQLELLVGHLQKRLVNIHSPVQIIQARQDDMTSVKNAQLIYDRVSSKDKEIVILEDSYHIVTADQERGKVLENMQRFFLRHCPQVRSAHV